MSPHKKDSARDTATLTASAEKTAGRIAEHRLGASSYLALRAIHCEFEDGRLRLRGRVRSQYLKQVAQQIVADIDGVAVVENQIEVVPCSNTLPESFEGQGPVELEWSERAT